MSNLLLSILKASPKLMERTTLNVNLTGWPGAFAITGSVGMLCTTAVYVTHARLKQKELEANQNRNSSAEGVSEETAGGAILDDSPSRENPSSL